MDRAELVGALASILATINPKNYQETDLAWTKYRSMDELATQLTSYIEGLAPDRLDMLPPIKADFGPTVSFQELAISTG